MVTTTYPSEMIYFIVHFDQKYNYYQISNCSNEVSIVDCVYCDTNSNY